MRGWPPPNARGNQEAARREDLEVPCHDPGRVLGIQDVMQAADEQQRDGLGKVKQLPCLPDYLIDGAQVPRPPHACRPWSKLSLPPGY
jgi:hypothetical protein